MTYLPILLSLFSCTMDQGYVSEEPKIWGEPSEYFNREEVRIEEFRTPKRMPLDILLVLDRSSSMNDDLYKIRDNLQYLLTLLNSQNIDFRLSMITADNQSKDTAGALINTTYGQYIDSNTAEPYTTFDQMLLYSGMLSAEAGVDALNAALTINFDKNKDFFRENTPLYIINASDEKDQSTYWDTSDLLSTLYDYEFDNKSDVIYSSVVILPTSECMFSNIDIGWDYMYLSAHTNGKITDICDANWTQIFDDIYEYALTIEKEYPLSSVPREIVGVMIKEGPVTIVLDKEEFTFDSKSNSVILDLETNPGDIVLIEYKI